MNLFEIVILAIALGIDCLVVSFSLGLSKIENRKKVSIQLASIMGLFQGLMPVIGFLGATMVFYYIAPIAKFLVFLIFFVLGLKCFSEVFFKSCDNETCSCFVGFKHLLLLGIATSIDALGSGVSLKLTNTSLLYSCLIIGIVSFLMSILGFKSGCRLNCSHTKRFEIFAGLILIFLAIKSLY